MDINASSIASNSTAVVVGNQQAIPQHSAATASPINQSTAPSVAPISDAKTGQVKTLNNSSAILANFDKIKNGMTYAEVARILGSTGEKAGEFEVQDGIMTTYRWKGTEPVGGWEVAAQFNNVKLVNKTQFGLK